MKNFNTPAHAAELPISTDAAEPPAAQPIDEVKPPISREAIRLDQQGAPTLALQRQGRLVAGGGALSGQDVVYVHGATFGADLSVFFRLGGLSRADSLNEAGFQVWGFDFAGYGASERYPADSAVPAGWASEALPQLERVVSFIRRHNAGRPVMLVAHSWGTIVAAQFAAA